MNSKLRFPLVAALGAAGIAVFVPAASAATTYYAAPSGSGTTCSKASPCKIETAVEKGQNGDSVVVEPGTYVLAESVLTGHSVDIGGQAGASPPTLQTSSASNVRDTVAAKATFHDLRISGTGGLVLSSGLAERVYVDYTGVASSGCTLAVATTFRDSVCWSHSGGFSDAIDVGAPGSKGTAVLRNDTFVSEKEDGLGADASGGGELTVDGANLVVRGGNGVDVSSEISGLSTSFVKLSNSDYKTVEEMSTSATVTAPGTAGNIIADPLFVAAASGDFAEAAGSPTVDAGLTDPLIGATDLLGNPRSLPACIGGTPLPDIGAYELVPTTPCATPEPEPTVSNRFRLGKLKLNQAKGTAKLTVTVFAAGKLTLSGKGLRKVTRTAKRAGSLVLAVKPVGVAKRKLEAAGRAKLKLKLKWAPRGGALARKTKTVTLKEALGGR
jgi:hypothetical protein